jgi:hypothetical protein
MLVTTEFHETRGVLISSASSFMQLVRTSWSPHNARALFFTPSKRPKRTFRKGELSAFMVARRHIDGCSSGRQSPAVAVECL